MKSLLALVFLIVAGCSFAKPQPLPTAEHVDIERYVGDWYTITSLPQFFTRNCKDQKAHYEIINPQTISVLNTCIKANGKTSSIKGQAVVVNAATNAELQVTFNSFFTRLFRVKGDYTIIELDEGYRYVMVGSKNRKSLWVLARETTMPAEILKAYVAKAKALGFPVEKLRPEVIK